MTVIATLLGSYLLGAIPFGLLVGKAWGSVDVRRLGSGNIGTSNVMRTVGKGAAVAVLILDVLKGVLPVLAARWLGLSPTVVALAALLAVFGHIWPWVLKFQGGKGIATAFGTAIALDLRIAALLVVVWVLVLVATRYISVASIAAAVTYPVLTWVFGAPVPVIAAVAGIALAAIVRHRSNVRRLMSGEEFRFGERVAPQAGRR